MTANLPARIEAEMVMARALSTSSLVPRDFRGQPANVLLAVSLGNALGLEPAIALTSIKVIDGQPTLSAQLQAALVRRAGHRLRIVHEEGSATAILIRKDDPDYEHRVTWTMARAERAGLAGKGAWRQYADQMLANRATTEIVRMAASDVLLGVAYDPEELGAEVEVEVVPEPVVDVETGEIVEAEVVEP